jgi:hypothetical protein
MMRVFRTIGHAIESSRMGPPFRDARCRDELVSSRRLCGETADRSEEQPASIVQRLADPPRQRVDRFGLGGSGVTPHLSARPLRELARRSMARAAFRSRAAEHFPDGSWSRSRCRPRVDPTGPARFTRPVPTASRLVRRCFRTPGNESVSHHPLWSRGRSKRNVAPRPGSLSTSSFPPFHSA